MRLWAIVGAVGLAAALFAGCGGGSAHAVAVSASVGAGDAGDGGAGDAEAEDSGAETAEGDGGSAKQSRAKITEISKEPPSVLAASQGSLQAFANEASEGILALSKAALGSTARGEEPQSMAIDDTHVYWSTRSCRSAEKRPPCPDVLSFVYMVPRGGGATIPLTPGGIAKEISPIAATSGYVYFGTRAGHGKSHVLRVRKGYGKLEEVADKQDDVRFVAADDSNVYWLAGPSVLRRKLVPADPFRALSGKALVDKLKKLGFEPDDDQQRSIAAGVVTLVREHRANFDADPGFETLQQIEVEDTTGQPKRRFLFLLWKKGDELIGQAMAMASSCLLDGELGVTLGPVHASFEDVLVRVVDAPPCHGTPLLSTVSTLVYTAERGVVEPIVSFSDISGIDTNTRRKWSAKRAQLAGMKVPRDIEIVDGTKVTKTLRWNPRKFKYE